MKRSSIPCILFSILMVVVPLPLLAAPLKIAFLCAQPSLDKEGVHNRAAWDAAQEMGDATVLFRHADGRFKDVAGSVRSFSDFDVVWYHQGDAIRRTGVYHGASLGAIRSYAEKGGGVLLSGGALAMVAQLRLETEIRPQRHDLGNYRDVAEMVSVETNHPVFRGVPVDRPVGLSEGGCQAVADFYWGGPAEGVILARTRRGVENPLVEYALGKGRVIVFGWRWPDYADLDNAYRPNLLRLTGNLLSYLADAESWREVVIRSDFPDLDPPGVAGIPVARWESLRLAIDDLSSAFPNRYTNGVAHLEGLAALRDKHDKRLGEGAREGVDDIRKDFRVLQREALLDNPLLDFDRLLLIRRQANNLGLLHNSYGNAELRSGGYNNTLVSVSPVQPGGAMETIFAPQAGRFIGDLDLNCDGERLLLSMQDANGRCGVVELDLVTHELSALPLIDEPDVHNYDACYLPDGRIVFVSTAPFVGVPCVNGKSKVGHLYLRDSGGRIRRLTNDQDHNWCPTVLNNGRVLYQRWEYADIAHAFTRLLFHCGPDGARQMEYYGSNSFWPTTMFYARAIPGHPTKIAAIVGGHHDAPRQGDLVILDPARGRFEADGVVQRIPGRGKTVEPVILDGLIGSRWPRFLHPYPLSEHYFLVSCKPSRTALWGVYLVDVFDNFLLLVEEPGWALFEPVPVRQTVCSPAVPDTADREKHDATVLLMDVYTGPGLAGVPRGAVKALRLVSYAFTFQGFGGEPNRVGFDGPWDVKRILGTVPVEDDGSAFFRVPATTPVAVQPLDGDGKALALMRSWFTAMPGETLSCVGCHEPQNGAPPSEVRPRALQREPSSIKPWYGPPRGFSFVREVQPVLDAYCVACHHGRPLEDGRTAFDLTARPPERVSSAFKMRFTPSYTALRRYVHAHTLESDAHLLPPRNFHADTSKLVQILRDGHNGVELSTEAWDRLITWIDLNAPAHGTWEEVVGHDAKIAPLVKRGALRRRELNRRYSGFDRNPEAVHAAAVLPEAKAGPSDTSNWSRRTSAVEERESSVPDRRGTRLRTATAGHAAGSTRCRDVRLADGVVLRMVFMPPGEFVMGSDSGYPNERPAHVVTITNGFWMGKTEISNREYGCFDRHHDSGLETGEQYAFGDYERGHLLNRPEQPVVRVSWCEAVAFCEWLSDRTGLSFSLPTEAQWEFACRAGTVGPLWYGSLDDDFSRVANVSDATHYTVDYPHVPSALPPWRPADTRFDDRWRVSAPVASFAANSRGLHDMHGNVAEWTRSLYRPYPYSDDEGRNAGAAGRRVVRGGSWMDRPRRARSSFRLHYEASQGVHDVGFRVVCEK